MDSFGARFPLRAPVIYGKALLLTLLVFCVINSEKRDFWFLLSPSRRRMLPHEKPNVTAIPGCLRPDYPFRFASAAYHHWQLLHFTFLHDIHFIAPRSGRRHGSYSNPQSPLYAGASFLPPFLICFHRTPQWHSEMARCFCTLQTSTAL